MKRKLKFLVITIALLLPIALLSFKNFQNRADFSGTWIINIEKSEFGEAPHYTASKEITIKQFSNQIDVQKIGQAHAGGDTTVKEKSTFDGQFTKIITADNGIKSLKAQWSQDSQSLVYFTSCTMPNSEKEYYHQSEKFSLSPNGKSLTEVKQVEINDGSKYQIIAVYDKK